ncbi:tRNA (guanosine(46)-N7)-methyltransferase TrmB [Alicyclobacillus tolerans]|uniref:tRNA (guanosine(46)-N7)-methyltransferase TrmB n=1 Tax=Alicyclobacillus tolerans TaxID=90970 RepID=UPI003B814FB9
MRIRRQYRLPLYQQRAGNYLWNSAESLLNDTDFWLPEKQVCMEVGCGRGAFLCQLASQFPDIHFLGVDIEPYLTAFTATRAREAGLKNIRTLSADISTLMEHLPRHRLTRIYLNFSDPWPHRRHEKRRLTHPRFIQLYERWLNKDGALEQKTDNGPFFAWSIQQFQKVGWTVCEIEHHVGENGLSTETCSYSGKYIQTDFETRFRQEGLTIHYLLALPPKTL